VDAWCECWSIKINDDGTQAIYAPHRRRPVEAQLTLKGWNIAFVNHVKYLGAILIKKYTENAYRNNRNQAFRTYIRVFIPLQKWTINR
jgi:hypothetical protein